MALTSGIHLGPYEVTTLLGAGGMGEVYRARDTKLGREVAIKILPRAFTADPDRLARFEREARVLATLNHPHIGAIYGFEENDPSPHSTSSGQAGSGQAPVRALVLELVEGQTLAERIARGALPIAEALTIARQIADALDAAHEKGIVHRDLKPANIKITPEGVVKVLDFGLAKLDVAEADARAASQSPTMTIGGTRDGIILGTAAYMSPEQARGQAVDKRTDIWAFGCVLYELLTGRVAFAGNTVSDTIAKILEREPDWDALPAQLAPAVRRLLERCLDKDPKRRVRDIGDMRIELEVPAVRDDATAPSGTRASRQWVVRWSLAAVALVIVGAIAASLWMLSRRDVEVSQSVTRTAVTLPVNQELDAGQTAAPLALSADGRLLAYVARSEGRTRLYLRSLDAFNAKVIIGTDSARYPFFSPDGQWVAFFADGKLKRVSIAGGAPVPICDAPVIGRGGTWGPDGTIVFDPGNSGLMRVAAQGGHPERVTSRDAGMDARDHSWPQFLPDGRGLLTTVGPGLIEEGVPSVAVLLLSTGDWHVLGPGSQAQYLSSGYLIYHAPHVREGELDAVPFDVETATFRGAPVSVLDGVFRAAAGGAAFFAVAQTGALVFAPGGFSRALVQVDRSGRRTSLSDERLGYRFPRFSPDGRKVAVTIDPRPSQIWVYDIERGSRIPLATNGITPLWTLDGQRIAFSSRGGIYWRAADGSSESEQLLASDHVRNLAGVAINPSGLNPTSWTPDGRLLVFQEDDPASGYDIWVAPRDGDPRSLVSTTGVDIGGKLSPDGKWLAYYSNESGRNEVYVRPFPNVNEQKWTVSTAGGQTPVWSPDGRELFFMNGTAMMSVDVETRGPGFLAGKPQFLFDGPFDTTQDLNFDISPDGTHFVMVEADPDAKPTRLQIVLNWSAELNRLVPGFGK